ncbi:MAG TPA: peroxide stress protein YaaA [Flavobacteriaceae bacterium]|nr:peroxide stress protein YaaA [Flavobacteriaceae bacterium]
MKILLSPSKSLELEQSIPISKYTLPVFKPETEKLLHVLKKKTKKELSKLMHISDKLAQLNYDRFQAFTIDESPTTSRQAMFAFSGDVYEGLDAYTLSDETIDRAQNTIRILSGLYGLLKPLDLMQPYRLEMGTKLKIGRKNDLYAYWDGKIADELIKEIQEDEPLVNLASVEYYKAVKTEQIPTTIITPIFKDFKNGNLKIISFFAKKARGMMARYILENDCKNYDGLLAFDSGGYAFSAAHTLSKNQPVFIR